MAATMANPKPITGQLAHVWLALMEHAGVGPEDFLLGVRNVCLQQTFFPSPADVIRAIRPQADGDTEAELAWQYVIAAVQRLGSYASLTPHDLGGDRAALWSLERMGWVRLCEMLGEEENGRDNRSIIRAEFTRIYKVAVANNGAADYVRGRLEIENIARSPKPGDLSPAQCGRPDWDEFPPERDGIKAMPRTSLSPAIIAELVDNDTE